MVLPPSDFCTMCFDGMPYVLGAGDNAKDADAVVAAGGCGDDLLPGSAVRDDARWFRALSS